MPDLDRMMIFIDGENLVFRYQQMLKKGGNPHADVDHIPDVFFWHHNLPPSMGRYKIPRATYYTYAVGDEKHLESLHEQIKAARFHQGEGGVPPYLTPKIFKKPKQQAQKKGVDIQLTVDVLTQVYNDNIDAVYLMSGDGDYIPLIEEVKRRGKQVYVAAFSEGRSKSLIYAADHFANLDDEVFFNPPSNNPSA